MKWMDSKLNTRQILIALNYFFHTHFDIIFSFVIMLLIKNDKSFHHLSVLIVLLLLMKLAPGFISGVKGATFGRIERERQALLKFKDLIDNFGILSSWFSSWDLLATYSSLWFSKDCPSSNLSCSCCKTFRLSLQDCLSRAISFPFASQLRQG